MNFTKLFKPFLASALFAVGLAGCGAATDNSLRDKNQQKKLKIKWSMSIQLDIMRLMKKYIRSLQKKRYQSECC